MGLPPIDEVIKPELSRKLERDQAVLRKIFFDESSKKVAFYFIPSTKLREIVAKGEEPLIKGMPNGIKEMILSGAAHCLQKRMVYELLTGKLDKKNSFILNNGEIRVMYQDSYTTHHEPIIKTGN